MIEVARKIRQIKEKHSLAKYDKVIRDYEYDNEEDKLFIAIKLNNKWSFFNTETGKEIMPFKYDKVDNEFFREGFARVWLNGKVGFVNEKGQEITSPKYDDASWFKRGFAYVSLNGKRGVIDITGKEIVALKYDKIEDFSNELACVKLNGKYGYVDKTGQEVILLKYDEAGSFYRDYAKVTLAGKELKIDKKGNATSIGLVLLDEPTYKIADSEGKEIIVTFRFKNNSDKEIIITKVSASYGTTTVALDKVIKPGEIGRIQDTWKNHSYPNRKTKFITVYTQEDIHYLLQIEGK